MQKWLSASKLFRRLSVSLFPFYLSKRTRLTLFQNKFLEFQNKNKKLKKEKIYSLMSVTVLATEALVAVFWFLCIAIICLLRDTSFG